MATLAQDRFSGTLSQWTLVELGATVAIASGQIVLTQTDGSDNQWNRIGATLTSPITSAAGAVVYWQFTVDDITVTEDIMFVLSKALSLTNNFAGTCSARINGNVLVLYDDAVGNIGSSAVSSDQAYDNKIVFNVDGTVTLSTKTAGTPGDLPTSILSGAWTEVGTSTTNGFNGISIYPSWHLKTRAANTAWLGDEFYWTSDGSFTSGEGSGGGGANMLLLGD